MYLDYDIDSPPFNKIPDLVSIEAVNDFTHVGSFMVSSANIGPITNADMTYTLKFRGGKSIELTRDELDILFEELYRGASFEDALVVAKI